MSEEQEEKVVEKIKKQLYLNNEKKGVMDALQEKMISRKLLVFSTATALMYWSDLDPETWGMIAMMYITGQSVIDAVKAWKWGG